MWRKFSGNSSRVEAINRTLLATVFVVALWLDPLEPVRDPPESYLLLWSFLIWSVALIVIAWRSWWWDHRLAPLVHVVDIAVFVCAVYFTEAPNADFSSPFMAFAVLLLIKAQIRWDWHVTAFTALALFALDFAAAGAMVHAGYAIDLFRYERRAAYMVLLSLLVVWLGLGRRVGTGAVRPLLLREPDPERMLGAVIAHARAAAGAAHAAIAWAAAQEPWIRCAVSESAGARTGRLGPAAFGPDFPVPEQAMLFDLPRRRRLALEDDGRVRARLDPLPLALADHAGCRQGLAVPLASDGGRGLLVLWDAVPPHADLLPFGRNLGEQIVHAFDREERAALTRTAAVNAVRQSLARDLHDSFAQFLAGTQFRLEALRRWIRAGNDPEPEIDAIRDALRREQGQLREMIGKLRTGETADRHGDAVEELRALLDELAAHWHIVARLTAPEQLEAPIALVHDLRQLVREAVANSARHGQCGTVAVALALADGAVRLAVEDDGRGFGAAGPPPRPRSISERVAALGGTLVCGTGTGGGGARLEITLPLAAGAKGPTEDMA